MRRRVHAGETAGITWQRAMELSGGREPSWTGERNSPSQTDSPPQAFHRRRHEIAGTASCSGCSGGSAPARQVCKGRGINGQWAPGQQRETAIVEGSARTTAHFLAEGVGVVLGRAPMRAVLPATS